jgi:hypothetical protein
VHVWDGDVKIDGSDNLALYGDQGMKQFTVKGTPDVKYGIGISVRVAVGIDSSSSEDSGTIQFTAAGCDFV